MNLRPALRYVESALDRALEFVGPYVDVVDGPEGCPQANEAMQLHAELSNAVMLLRNAIEAVDPS